MQASTYHQGRDRQPVTDALLPGNAVPTHESLLHARDLADAPVLQRRSGEDRWTADVKAFLRRTTELDRLVTQGQFTRFHDRAANLVG